MALTPDDTYTSRKPKAPKHVWRGQTERCPRHIHIGRLIAR